jgi:hypothetical protein
MLKFLNFNIRSKSEVDTSLANAGPLASGGESISPRQIMAKVNAKIICGEFQAA